MPTTMQSQYRVLQSAVGQLAKIFIRPFRRVKVIALIAVLVVGALGLLPGVAQAQAATTEVQVGSEQGSLAFDPTTVTIQPGDTVKWTNKLKADSACDVVFDKVRFGTYPFAAGRLPSEVI